MVMEVITGALIGLSIIFGVTAVVCASMLCWDWCREHRQYRRLEREQQEVRDAWRVLTLERQRFLAEQQLHYEAIHAITRMTQEKTDDLRDRVARCKLNHPSGQPHQPDHNRN